MYHIHILNDIFNNIIFTTDIVCGCIFFNKLFSHPSATYIHRLNVSTNIASHIVKCIFAVLFNVIFR